MVDGTLLGMVGGPCPIGGRFIIIDPGGPGCIPGGMVCIGMPLSPLP